MGGPGSGRKKGGGGSKRKIKIAKRKSVWDSMSDKQRSQAKSRDRFDAQSSARKNWK